MLDSHCRILNCNIGYFFKCCRVNILSYKNVLPIHISLISINVFVAIYDNSEHIITMLTKNRKWLQLYSPSKHICDGSLIV